MAFPERLAIATRNAHKLRELRRICHDWPVAWFTVEDHAGPWPDVAEPHETYRENAAAKARAVAEALGVPAIADDSGIEVDELRGAPGPRSARFAGEDATDEANLSKLLEALETVPAGRRGARYRCVAALAWPDGRLLHAEATCEGTIGFERRGERGFGYDPAFVPEGETRTMAELTDEEKDRISHRGRAFRALARLVAGRPIRDLPSALERLDEIGDAVRGRRAVVFLDYDGTLTPIVEDPDAAVLDPQVREALRELARTVPVAVISGRDLDDVRRMVRLLELWYAGSHGFDIAGPAGERLERAPGFLPDLDEAERELAPLVAEVPGARLERKRFAIAVHVRRVDEERVPEVERAVALVAASRPRLRTTGGKRVLELRPALAWDKGAALRWLLEVLEPDRPDAVPLYVGDDETDEDAFLALDARGIGIVVRGERDERTTAARFALGDPGEVLTLLRRLRSILD